MKTESVQESFKTTFLSIASRFSRKEVFADFIRVSANFLDASVSTGSIQSQLVTEMPGRYSEAEIAQLDKLFNLLCDGLEIVPHDFLGEAYMTLELGNHDMGQFFSSDSLATLKTSLLMDNHYREILQHGFMTVVDPACGSGGLAIAVVRNLVEHGIPPALNLFVQCTDIDHLAADMAFIQLSLLAVPAEIITGDSLRVDYRKVRFTTMYHYHNFHEKLKFRHFYEELRGLFR